MKLLRLILFFINLAFALLLLFSTLAGGIPPSKFVGFSLLSYAYVLLFGINVFFVLLWLLLRRWEFLLSAIIIVLRCSFIPLFFQLSGTSQAKENADESRLRVMTFNVHIFSGRDGELTYREGAKQFVDLVREEQPDVLCLQEYYNKTSVYNVTDTLARMGYRYSHKHHNSRIGLMLFSKYKLRNVQDLGQNRKFYADIQKDGVPVRLLCVHLASYNLGYKDLTTVNNIAHGQRDRKAIGMISKFCRTVRQHEKEWDKDLQPVVANHQGHLILLGDCNDTPASYLYQQVSQSLNDTYREHGFGLGTTYHGPFPAYRIDYVFHSPSLEALSYKRIRCNISDHYPLVAEYRLK